LDPKNEESKSIDGKSTTTLQEMMKALEDAATKAQSKKAIGDVASEPNFKRPVRHNPAED
jgi:hypothetical protein